MKKYLLAITICIITVTVMYLFIKVDENSKKVAGYLEGNVVFKIDKNQQKTIITILNEKICF